MALPARSTDFTVKDTVPVDIGDVVADTVLDGELVPIPLIADTL